MKDGYKVPIYLTSGYNERILDWLLDEMWGRLRGMLVTPFKIKGTKLLERGVTWAADNGLFSKAGQRAYTDDLYRAFLRERRDFAATCLFATAPDVLHVRPGGYVEGDARATWARSRPLFDDIRRLGFKAALVAQDGLDCMLDEIEWDAFDVLFIGGSDLFKLAPGWGIDEVLAAAGEHGKPVHLGRVNSEPRYHFASYHQMDSVDGTCISCNPQHRHAVGNWQADLYFGWADPTYKAFWADQGGRPGGHGVPR